jgi:hypothetical protein
MLYPEKKSFRMSMKRNTGFVIIRNGVEYKAKANSQVKSTIRKIQEKKCKMEKECRKNLIKHNLYLDQKYGMSISNKYLKHTKSWNTHLYLDQLKYSLFIGTIMKFDGEIIVVHITNSKFILAYSVGSPVTIETKIKISVSEFESMRNKFLKNITNYHQMIVKSKLETEHNLMKKKDENKKLRGQIDKGKTEKSKEFCCCCLEFPDIIFPCGHLACCEKCVVKFRKKECPLCRKGFNNYIKVYRNTE